MSFTIKIYDANVTANYSGVNNTNPSTPFHMYQTDIIQVPYFATPQGYDPAEQSHIEQLSGFVCEEVARSVGNYLTGLGVSSELVSQWNKNYVRVWQRDQVTQIPTQFTIYFPEALQQELERVLSLRPPQQAEPAHLSQPPAPPSGYVPAGSDAAAQPPQQPYSAAPPLSSLPVESAAAQPRRAASHVQQPLPLQSQDLHRHLRWFEDVFTRRLGIEGGGNDRRYQRNADNGIHVIGNTAIDTFSENYLIANIKPLLKDPLRDQAKRKHSDKIPNFPRYTADLDIAVREIWNSLMAKMLVIEEMRLALIEKRNEITTERGKHAQPDQSPIVTRLERQYNSKFTAMQEKENEVIFILNAYRTMFDAIQRADQILSWEDRYTAKFAAIDTCCETLVHLGWKGRLFVTFCTLLGIVIGAAAGFVLGATGGVIAGATAGTVLMPVPIVGSVKGAIAGGTVGGVWTAVKAGGIGGAIGAGVGAALMGLAGFGFSWYGANRTYAMDASNLHFFKACRKVVKHAQWFEEPSTQVSTSATIATNTMPASRPL